MSSLPTRFYAEMTAAVASLAFPVECGVAHCQTVFEDPHEEFEEHIIDHFEQRLYKCLMCYQMFKTGIAYHLHKEHDQPYSADLYKDLRHVYQDDLIKVMKRAFRIKDDKKRRRSEPVRLNAPELASNPEETMSKYPEPRRFFAFLRLVQKELSGKEDETYCKFRDCDVVLEDTGINSLETHVLTHYDPEMAKCIGCKTQFQNVGMTLRHTCPKVLIADLRGNHEENLIEVTKECFPLPEEIKIDALKVSTKTPKEQPTEYLEKLHKLVEKLEKGETKAKCRYRPCRQLVVGSQKCQVKAAEKLIEEHVLSHLGSIKLTQCLLCWKKLINSSPAEIELHFRKLHTTGTEPQYQDLRAVYETDLVETLLECFPNCEDVKLESEEETPTPGRRGRKRKGEDTDTERTPVQTPKRGRPSLFKTPLSSKKTPKTPRLTKPELQLRQEFEGLDGFVQTIKELFGKEKSCSRDGCTYSLPKTAWPHVLGKHVLSHFDQPFYKCKMCETNLKYPAQHMTIKHGISDPDSTHYEDLRSKFQPALIRMTHSCFGTGSQIEEVTSVKDNGSSPDPEVSIKLLDDEDVANQADVTSEVEKPLTLMEKIQEKFELTKNPDSRMKEETVSEIGSQDEQQT